MAGKTNIAVRCENLTKVYGSGEAEVKALRGVNLDIREGELLLITGPSGCGKTTLISIIAAILDQTEGVCEVLGKNFQNMNALERADFRGNSLGFVFQVFNLLPSLTTVENVSVPLLLAGIMREQAEAQAVETLKLVSLADRTTSLPRKMSGGQQQRVAIARALVHNPQLIICDEPTSNLDHKTGQAMMDLLKDKAKNPNRTIIVVTHDPRIYGFADRIARMDDGRIIEILEGKEKEKLL